MIDVIDYRAGNGPSVMFAMQHLGIPCRLSSHPEDLATAERIILPGVGAARPTMESLRESDLLGALNERVLSDGVPFLGICVGLQVLLDHSEEGDVDGLGWVGGVVRRFPDDVRVPQIGWNGVRPRRAHPLWDGMPEEAHCYFVNSYFAIPADDAHTLATTHYSAEFASMVGRDNIAATQFHAEKSGQLGLRLLTNFAQWDGRGC